MNSKTPRPDTDAAAPLDRRQRVVFICLLALAVGLRLLAASGPRIYRWDEAHHALVAKHLAAHPLEPTLFDDPDLPHDDREWQRARVWLHKPPLALWAMAASIRAFGASPIALRLPSVLLDSLAVLVTFLLGRRLLGLRGALAAMAFHALGGNSLLLVGGFSATDHVDLQLACWVELAMYGVVRFCAGGRAWLALVGVATGAALLTKGAPGLLPLAVLGAASVRRLRDLPTGAAAAGAGGALGLLIALPWNLYARARWPEVAAMESSDQLSHLWLVSQAHAGHPLYHLEKLGEMHGVLAYLPVGWLGYRSFKQPDWRLRLLSAWWLVPFVVFTISATKMTNYMALAAPAVSLMAGAFVAELLPSRHLGRRLLAVAVAVAALVAFGRDLRRVTRAQPGAVGFARAMRALPERTVVLGVDPFLQAMFFGAHAAYPEVWPAEQRAAVAARGYRVVVASCDGRGELPLPAGFCAGQP